MNLRMIVIAGVVFSAVVLAPAASAETAGGPPSRTG